MVHTFYGRQTRVTDSLKKAYWSQGENTLEAIKQRIVPQSWQIVPKALDQMIRSGTKEQAARVTEAFLKMKKFDLATLQRAFDGK
jgi:hypothetical protein